MLPGQILQVLAAAASGRLSRRSGTRTVLAAGCALTAGGLVLTGLAGTGAGWLVLWNGVVSIGCGFGLAACANLIVEATPPSETGEATGFNTVVRSIGAALAAQVSGALLLASAVAGVPTAGGFQAAFLVGAAMAAAAALVAWLIALPESAGLHAQPAVDGEVRAGHPSGLRTGHPGDQRGDLAGIEEPTGRPAGRQSALTSRARRGERSPRGSACAWSRD